MRSHYPVASTCALLRCYESAQACPPGAGLVTRRRLGIERFQVQFPAWSLWCWCCCCCCCFLEQETLLQSTQLLKWGLGGLVPTGEAAHPAVTSMGTWCKLGKKHTHTHTHTHNTTHTKQSKSLWPLFNRMACLPSGTALGHLSGVMSLCRQILLGQGWISNLQKVVPCLR